MLRLHRGDTELTASAGDSYQWYLFDDAVTGGTGQQFEYNVLEYGVYAVDVTDNGCTTHSTDFVYLVTGLEKTSGLRIYPNPVTNDLHIELQDQKDYNFKLIDLQGRIIKEIWTSPAIRSIILKEIPTGTYILRIQSKDFITYRKIVKIS